jgi:hypothetical protein
MKRPLPFRRIGETATEILGKLEKIHGDENAESTDKHDSGSSRAGRDPVR